MEKNSSNYRLLSGLFFRLLPFQVLLLIITSVNGIVDSLYASNQIGQTAMSAIGLFGPLNHFLYAASIMFVSGSQVLYGRYLARDRGKIPPVHGSAGHLRRAGAADQLPGTSERKAAACFGFIWN